MRYTTCITKISQRLARDEKLSDLYNQPMAKRAAPAPVTSGDQHTQNIVGHVSVRSIIRSTAGLALLCGGTYLVILLREIIILFLLGLFIATVLHPSVAYLQRWHIPRRVAILLHYVVILVIAGYLLITLVPIVAKQIASIATIITNSFTAFSTKSSVSLPFLSPETNLRITLLLKSILRNLSVTSWTDALEQAARSMATMTAGSIGIATQIISGVLQFFGKCAIVLLFAFFMISERKTMGEWIKNFLPRKYLPYCERKFLEIDVALGNWLRGQMILGLIIGSMVFIVLTVIGVPNALTLAILAGCLEFIPNVGPILSAIPAVIIGTAEGGTSLGLLVALCYYVIQALENNFIVPLIMQRSLNISPVASIFAMLVGISFPEIIHPIVGVLLSIPLTSIVGIFLNDLRDWHSKEILKSTTVTTPTISV